MHAGDEDRTNLLVARLVRSCRMFRVVRGAAKLQAARIMVLVLLKTVVNSKWVLIVVTGFGACVCTLGLNWFGYASYCFISNDPATPRSLPAPCRHTVVLIFQNGPPSQVRDALQVRAGRQSYRCFGCPLFTRRG